MASQIRTHSANGQPLNFWGLYLGTTPHPVTVTTRIITFLIGNPYKPSFVTVTGWGVDLNYILAQRTGGPLYPNLAPFELIVGWEKM